MNLIAIIRLILEFLVGLLALGKRVEESNRIHEKEVVDEENKAAIHEAFKDEDNEALNNVFNGSKPSKLRDPET